ncbi:hypothetical protein A9Q98_13710 [Thalassotalea sp. 42_200_T64]|nr:hypothetical protein A9Q98_13710 [Thalassotalea sp. 42_200_T64]
MVFEKRSSWFFRRIVAGSTLLLAMVVWQYAFAFESQAANIYTKAVQHEKRLSKDIELDTKRKPADILPFTQIKTGDAVLELGAGGGYTTELVSLLVGDTGKVYAHFLYNKERLKDNRLPNVIPLREHSLSEHITVLEENNVGPNDLDAIIIFFVLHDIYLNSEMSEQLLTTLYSSLKPGGRLIILDNAAKPDEGLTQIGTLHRIGENFVKDVFVKAGFVIDQTSDVLRNKADQHTKPWGDFKGLQDRFAIRFKKPESL